MSITSPTTLTRTDLATARGLSATVLRHADPDPTNSGITTAANRVTIVGIYDPDSRDLHPLPTPAQAGPATPAAPAVLVTWHPQNTRALLANLGAAPGLYLVPATLATWHPAAAGRPMLAHSGFGGNYAATCDARFEDLLIDLYGQPYPVGPLPVHDRVGQ